MIDRFVREMNHVENLIRKKIFWRGLVNSLAECIALFSFAGTVYYGAYLIAAKEIHFKNFIKLVGSFNSELTFYFQIKKIKICNPISLCLF